MKGAQKFLWIAAACTTLFEIMVSSPWWMGMKSGNFDMLIRLTVPSIMLLIFSYYLIQKKYHNSSALISMFIVLLQISILLTIYGTIRGILP